MKSAYLIGINHNDPFGRQNAIRIMHRLKARGVEPDYIAVEWKEGFAKKLISWRPSLELKAKESFSGLSDKDIELLGSALAFEADCGQEVFPGSPTIWLDAKRCITQTPAQFVENRIKTYRQQWNGFEPMSLEELRTRIILIAKNGTPKSSSRDQDFFNAIIEKEHSTNFTIIGIVGKDHTYMNVEGTFAERLLSRGYVVKVFDGTIMQSV